MRRSTSPTASTRWPGPTTCSCRTPAARTARPRLPAARARVLHRDFDDFASQRNYGLEEAGLRHDWVLHLDADERVTPALREALRDRAECGEHRAYRVPSKLMFQGGSSTPGCTRRIRYASGAARRSRSRRWATGSAAPSRPTKWGRSDAPPRPQGPFLRASLPAPASIFVRVRGAPRFAGRAAGLRLRGPAGVLRVPDRPQAARARAPRAHRCGRISGFLVGGGNT